MLNSCISGTCERRTRPLGLRCCCPRSQSGFQAFALPGLLGQLPHPLPSSAAYPSRSLRRRGRVLTLHCRLLAARALLANTRSCPYQVLLSVDVAAAVCVLGGAVAGWDAVETDLREAATGRRVEEQLDGVLVATQVRLGVRV